MDAFPLDKHQALAEYHDEYRRNILHEYRQYGIIQNSKFLILNYFD